jgi:hypothetical protein
MHGSLRKEENSAFINNSSVERNIIVGHGLVVNDAQNLFNMCAYGGTWYGVDRSIHRRLCFCCQAVFM